MDKKRHRIGIDARFYGPLGKGLGRYTQEIVDNILKIDRHNEYVVFLGKENFDELQSDHPHLKKVLADVRWYTVAEQLFMPWLIFKEKLDLIHFPHFNVPLLCPVKFIVTIHDLILTKFPTMRATTHGAWLYFIKNLGYRLSIIHALKRARKVIAISKFTKTDIIDQFGINSEKIELTYEGTTNLSSGKDSRFASKLDHGEILSDYCILEPYILYVGNAYPHKNLEFLIKVFKELQAEKPDLKLVLVGKNDYFYARLKKFALELNANTVIFPGYVPDRDLEILFSRALAYVFPSKYEGFGLPPLEAMSRGCPVISSNSTCLPEVLGDAALFFDPDDGAQLKNQINNLINSENLRQDLIAKGYKRAKLYDWYECALQTSEIYERTVL
jgi:glycosyltransferase involved in cell wall biosynthesis